MSGTFKLISRLTGRGDDDRVSHTYMGYGAGLRTSPSEQFPSVMDAMRRNEEALRTGFKGIVETADEYREGELEAFLLRTRRSA